MSWSVVFVVIAEAVRSGDTAGQIGRNLALMSEAGFCENGACGWVEMDRVLAAHTGGASGSQSEAVDSATPPGNRPGPLGPKQVLAPLVISS